MIRSARVLSPLALLIVVWVITIVVALLPLAFPATFDISLALLRRQGMTPEDFSWIGLAWLCLAFGIFAVASLTTLQVMRPQKPFRGDMDFNRMARINFTVGLGLQGITLLWVLLTARELGGIGALAVLVQLDALEAREQLLDNTLFVGMRIIYGALPAVGAMAATLLAAGTKTGQLGATERRMSKAVFLATLVLLLILPIVMSQRLLLLQLIIASYVGLCMVHQRLVGQRYVPLGIGLFMFTWLAREALTNPTVDGGPLEVGIEKLVFYFLNDLLNSFMPFGHDFDHTYGYFSFRFLVNFTLTDGYFATLLRDELDLIGAIRGGGAWSVFTTPYVDFGAVGAAFYLTILSVLVTAAYRKASESPVSAAIYGHVAAALLLSPHTMYFGHANFIAMLIVTAVVGAFGRHQGTTSRVQSPQSPTS